MSISESFPSSPRATEPNSIILNILSELMASANSRAILSRLFVHNHLKDYNFYN